MSYCTWFYCFATKLLQLIAPIFPLKYSVSPKHLKKWTAENETAFSKTPLEKTNIMGLNSNSPRGRKWPLPPPAGIFLVRLRQALYMRFSNLSLSSHVSSTSGKCCYLNFARFLVTVKNQFLLVVDKTRNMEHGTFRNIPEHRIIMIIMRKICKIKLSKTEKTSNLDLWFYHKDGWQKRLPF